MKTMVLDAQKEIGIKCSNNLKWAYTVLLTFQFFPVISIFLNYLPLEISDVYLDMFFKYGWQALYQTAIEVLRYYKNDILQLYDPSDIMALIK